jgi:uncharacterized membrane protein YkvA (DUF1232 family)
VSRRSAALSFRARQWDIEDMASRVTSGPSRLGLIATLFSQVRLAARLVREPRVPWLVKGIPLLAAVYVASPLDFVPDVLPVLGQMDDLGIMLLALRIFLRACPPAAIDHHSAAIDHGLSYRPMAPGGDIIDAEFRRDN